MTVLIWGAGAIGGTIGAYLARAGENVLFVDVVGAHVDAINESGLTVEGPIETFTVKGKAVLPDALEGTFERVWLATKAQDTHAAAMAIAPHLSATGHILSLQNGLTELIVADVVGRERTLGAFINFGADYMAPGRILYGGRGACVVGELTGETTARLDDTLARLKLFDPGAAATDDIWGFLWGKLGYGALLFATALTNDSIADVLGSPAHWPVLTMLAREMTEAAHQAGTRPRGFNGYDPAAFRAGADPATSFQAMAAHNGKSAKTHSGIWRDLAVRKRRTEVDPLITKAVEIGAQHGLPMPLTRRLVEMIQEIERGERAMDARNLAVLAAAMEEAKA
ncbi:MAG: 2-dehydropantoate 2-reductase N-terminal domain-containing protein [Pseudomonadota bacterium]